MSAKMVWFAIRGSMGNFFVGADADHAGSGGAKRDKAKASIVALVKSMIAIGSCWTGENAE